MRTVREVSRACARVGRGVVGVAWLVLIAIKAFLDFKEEDGLWEKGEKTADFAVRRTTYLVADYALWLLSAAIFTTLKISGFSLVVIFFTLWVYDFLAAGAFILVYETTGKDLSLGTDFRRAKDVVHKSSRVAGYLVTLIVIFLAAVWTGPEKIVTFFRKEIRTTLLVVTVTIVLTAIQSFVWTILYDRGYGLVVELF